MDLNTTYLIVAAAIIVAIIVIVTAKRIDSNTYQVVGTDLIIITKYCYEYAYNEKAVLQYNGYSYSKGKLIFLK